MFTDNAKIGTIAKKASALFEIELCESIKLQTSNEKPISEFSKKNNKLYAIIKVILYKNYLKTN